MNDNDLEKQIASLRNLPWAKKLSEEELKARAIKILNKNKKEKKAEQAIESDVEWIGLDAEETKKANKKYHLWLTKHNIESYSDKQDLRNLIQQEAIYESLIAQLTAKSKKKTTGKVQPKGLTSFDIGALKQLNEVNLSLKAKLGLSTKKKETWKDFWLGLIKRIMFYIRTHDGQFQMKCPYCQQMVLLLRRIKNYDTFQWKCFRGTHLYNEEMMKDIQRGKLTQKDVARYWSLEHTDYIQGIYEEIFLKEQAVKIEAKKQADKLKEAE